MIHHESQLQQNCIYWFKLQYPKLSKLLFAIPNGSKRDKKTAAILKAEGVVSGVSDLILLVPCKGHSSLCIEMKHGKGRQTENQKEWQKSAELAGNKYIICRTVAEFMDAVNEYLI